MSATKSVGAFLAPFALAGIATLLVTTDGGKLVALALYLIALAAGLLLLINSRREEWGAELHEFCRKYLRDFCDGLDRANKSWRFYDYRGSGAKLETIGRQIGSDYYQSVTLGGTFADRSSFGSDAYESFEAARAGLVDICDRWGARWRPGGFGAFLDKQWKEYGQVLVMLGYVERAKAEASFQPNRLSETGLGRILARYYEVSTLRKVAPGPLTAAFPLPPKHDLSGPPSSQG